MRLAPKTLAGQLTLLLLLALAAAQGVVVALFAWERLEALRHAHRDSAVLRTATVARLLGDTPPPLHEAVIAAASTDIVRFSLAPQSLVVETGTLRRGRHHRPRARRRARCPTGPDHGGAALDPVHE